MKSRVPDNVEACRILDGAWASDATLGFNGAFFFKNGLRVVCSDGTAWKDSELPGIPWEHVSVSLGHRCPTWDEMCWVKRQFWDDQETVVQFHVPPADHVNHHPYCLHLWKPVGIELPRPPSVCVGPS